MRAEYNCRRDLVPNINMEVPVKADRPTLSKMKHLLRVGRHGKVFIKKGAGRVSEKLANHWFIGIGHVKTSSGWRI